MFKFKDQHFLDYFTLHSKPEDLARGYMLYVNKKVSDVKNPNEPKGSKSFIVVGITSDSFFVVRYSNIGAEAFSATCSCDEDLGCQHRVAVAYFIEKPTQKNTPQEEQYLDTIVNAAPSKPALFNSKTSKTIPITGFTPEIIDEFTSPNIVKKFQSIGPNFEYYFSRLLADVNIRVKIRDKSSYSGFPIELNFRFYGPNNINWESSCECYEKVVNGICVHKYAALVFLNKFYGLQKTSEIPTKAQLLANKLAEYGFKPEDDYSKYLTVYQYETEIQIHPKIVGLQKNIAAPAQSELLKLESNSLLQLELATETRAQNAKLYWLLYPHHQDLVVLPIFAKQQKTGKPAATGKKVNPTEMIGLALENEHQEIIKLYLSLVKLQRVKDVTKAQQIEKASIAIKILDLIKENQSLIVGEEREEVVRVSSIESLEINDEPPVIKFIFGQSDDVYGLEAHHLLNKKGAAIRLNDWRGNSAFVKNDQLFVVRDPDLLESLLLFNQFGNLVSSVNLPLDNFFNTYVSPISIKHEIIIKNIANAPKQVLLTPNQACLYIKDDAKERLRFVPIFKYQYGDLDAEFGIGGSGKMLISENNQIYCLNRDLAWEHRLVEGLTELHPSFTNQQNEKSFWLTFKQVMEEGWIAMLAEEANALGWTLLGQKDLKRFNYSLEKPVFDVKVSSGIDWFDILPSLAFGKEVVPLKKVKQAILKGENYVLLTDGTFGMLPAEWIKKLSTVFRLGKESKTGMRLNNRQLHTLQDDEGTTGLSNELDKAVSINSEAYNKLINTEQIPHFEPPLDLEVTLRPYQQKGYNWLSYHNELGTGALLADDMGLGKTIQALALLSAGLETNDKAKHLIVMPTSLLFNWEQEIKRFSPNIRISKHYGSSRSTDQLSKAWKNIDVILTTYGTLRSDIKLLEGFKFDMLVLDESHAIKNPDAAVSEAVRRINARFRLAMTGTPIENRTMDLFSQLDFLNPGLLGTKESFSEHYANAIDRGKNEQIAAELRKLVSPFILRRTKQQVVLDLPPKTETVIYSHLHPSQRVVYNAVRDEIKANIIETIRDKGRNAAGLLILAGITKLRQICASAAILRPEMAKQEEHSAKIDLLIEELQELTANYKVLVFSNFLGMMSLIADGLNKHNIGFCRMDGSTNNRQDVVDSFKNDETKRVFLMSMKTGGVGLNLTEAEYVYIMDPWWNPAVEQQAIDRTHRIGQSAPIFAYKLIAADTIEEKIIQLQQTKLKLAADLISTDEGVLAQLSDHQVLELFE